MNTTSTEQSWAVLQYTSQNNFGWDFGGMAIKDLNCVGMAAKFSFNIILLVQFMLFFFFYT